MSGTGGLPPIPLYEQYSANESKYVQADVKSNPTLQQTIAYFKKEAPKITSPEALLKNYRVLQVVLGAFNMSNLINEQGILKKLLTQNPNAQNSLVRQLANVTYLNFAKVMSNWNPPPFSNPQTIDTIVQNYQTNQFESNADQQSPGLQAALYFTRTIGSITTIPELMADPTLMSVVQTALGLPQEFGLLSYNQQVSILTKQVDLKKFQNPSYVKQFVERALILNQESGGADLSSQNSSATANPTLSLFA